MSPDLVMPRDRCWMAGDDPHDHFDHRSGTIDLSPLLGSWRKRNRARRGSIAWFSLEKATATCSRLGHRRDADWGQVPVVPTRPMSRAVSRPDSWPATTSASRSLRSLPTRRRLLIIASYFTFRDGSARSTTSPGNSSTEKGMIPHHDHSFGRCRQGLDRERGEPGAWKFPARADRYDRDASFPAEDFADLYRAGLHVPAAPRSHGGLGLGPQVGLFTLWMMTKELARADMALARCWEGHVDFEILLNALGNERQKDRWFQGIVERGEIWAAWSGEPQAVHPRTKGPIWHNRAAGEGRLSHRRHQGFCDQRAQCGAGRSCW